MKAIIHRYHRHVLWSTLLTVFVALLVFAAWPPRLGAPSILSMPAAVMSMIFFHVTEPAPAPVSYYIEIQNSCGIHYEGTCVVARSAATTSARSVIQLRDGIVLAVASTTITDETGRVWYHVIFDEEVRYPERISSTWYVAGDNVHAFTDIGTLSLPQNDTEPTTTPKHIVISRNEQELYAYDGDTLFLKTPISTGLDLTPTPRGVFHIYKKTPSRYMQGPLPGVSDQVYDLPGVPWDLYFTYDGGAIHGAYWHNSFGQQWSHGCVNLPLGTSHRLYDWADLGTEVIVQN